MIAERDQSLVASPLHHSSGEVRVTHVCREAKGGLDVNPFVIHR